LTPIRHFWRVEKEIFAATPKSGDGARIYGGRWNSPGLPAIYCAESLALSVLEILVHTASADERADPRIWFRLALTGRDPSQWIWTVSERSLPRGWNDPLPHSQTSQIGDQWLQKNKHPVMRVPSAVIPGAFNYILNPFQPHFRKAILWSHPTKLTLDQRLIDGGPDPAPSA
jgi:RES domain-containing protein